MASSLKFYRGSFPIDGAYVDGGIYFDNTSHQIRVGNGSGYDAFGSHIKDVTDENGVLVFSFYGATDLRVDLNDCASAQKVGELLDAATARISALETAIGHDAVADGEVIAPETYADLAEDAKAKYDAKLDDEGQVVGYYIPGSEATGLFAEVADVKEAIGAAVGESNKTISDRIGALEELVGANDADADAAVGSLVDRVDNVEEAIGKPADDENGATGLYKDIAGLDSRLVEVEKIEVPVKGLADDEKVLSIDGDGKLASNLSMEYADNTITLYGKSDLNGNKMVLGTVDCSDFLVNGVLKNVEKVTISEEDATDARPAGEYFMFDFDVDSNDLYIPIEKFAVSTYKAGTDLKLDGDVFSVATSNEVTVMGVTVGNYKSGDKILAGTSLSDILKNMLMKQIGVTANAASVSVDGTYTAGSYEYGTVIPAKPISVALTDGSYSGQPGYDYSLAAGCEKSNEKIVVTGVRAGTYDAPYSCASFVLTNETSFQAKADISAATNVPVDNMGNKVTEGLIEARTGVVSSKITYTPFAYWFLVHDDGTADIDSACIRSGKKVKEVTKTLNYNAPTDTVRSILALRKGVKTLKSVEGNFGALITDSFIKQNSAVSVEGATSDWSADYDVYVYTRAAGNSAEEKINITIA